MKRVFLLIVFMVAFLFTCQIENHKFIFVPSAHAQYADYVDHYEVYFRQLDAGHSAVLDSAWSTDSITHRIVWVRGDESSVGDPGYSSPWAGVYVDTLTVPNVPGLWISIEAKFEGTVTLLQGVYELTVKEFTPTESGGQSNPYIFEVRLERATVVIIMGIE